MAYNPVNTTKIYESIKELEEFGFDRQDIIKILGISNWQQERTQRWIDVYRETKDFARATFSVYRFLPRQRLVLVSKNGNIICIGKVEAVCKKMGFCFKFFIFRANRNKFKGFDISEPDESISYDKSLFV